MRFLLLVVGFWMVCSGLVRAVEISVLPDRNPVVAGEEFTLTFSSDGQPAGNPDFSPLSKDFDIIGQSTSRNVQIINGVASQRFSWRVTLFPKSSGTLQIPPIRFGTDTSPIVNIRVVDEQTSQQGQQGVLVELAIETKDRPYVQQQVIVVQRLLHASELRRNGAHMSHPEISEGRGIIEQLGGIKNTAVVRNGVRYRVSERRYALFPQTSGKLTIGRTVFQGVLDDGSRRRNPFSRNGRQIRRYSRPVTLNIREQPAINRAEWLPASSVSINAYWQTPAEQFKTGEPVTLTLAVIADGLLAEQLPELTVSPPKGIKSYSNQPELTNDKSGSSVIGTRQERWILIGTEPGEYTLPEISLQWWNLATGKLEKTSVQPSKIVVTGEVAANAGTEPPFNGAEGDDLEREEAAALIQEAGDAEIPATTNTGLSVREIHQQRFWVLLLGLAALMLLALAAIVWYYRWRKADRNAGDKQAVAEEVTRVDALELLKQACERNEAQKAYDALSDWVKQDLSLSPATLARLRQVGDLPLKQAMDDLSMALYAKQYEAWDGQALWRAVKDYRGGSLLELQQQEGLLSLYP